MEWAAVAVMLGKDEMELLNEKDRFKQTIRKVALEKGLILWRKEMSVAVANGIDKALGGK